MKRCPDCGEEKADDQLVKGKSYCKPCWAAKMKAYRQDPDKKARWYASRDRWKENNREKHLAIMKQWREEHPEQFRQRKREWAERNHEHDLELHRIWRRENPERWRKITRQAEQRLLERQPHYNREKFKRRQARKAGQTIGVVNYEFILDRDGLWCYLCQRDIADVGLIHFDHVIPLVRGGPHCNENIRVTHARCNLVKNDRLPEEIRSGELA